MSLTPRLSRMRHRTGPFSRVTRTSLMGSAAARSTTRLLLAFATGAALQGCSGRSGSDSPLEIFSPDLASAFRGYERTMSQPRTPLRFESGRMVRDCRGYLAVPAEDELDGTRYNRSIAGEYGFCDALKLLRDARPVPPARRPPSFYTSALIERLDLTSFRSSLRPQLDQEGSVLSAIPALKPKAKGFSVISDTADWYYEFEVVARADFTRDGREDWLVLFSDVSREGTYLDHGTLVVTDAGRAGMLQVGLQK
jgi:hypothetical protein